LNKFLYAIENFFKRLLVVFVACLIIPILFIGFLFGVWGVKVNKEDE